jgi:hypothetical protein
MTFRLSKKKN